MGCLTLMIYIKMTSWFLKGQLISILPMLGLFCNDYRTRSCRPSIQNVRFCIHPCISFIIYFMVKGYHLTLKKSWPLPSWQPLLIWIHYALFLVAVTIMTALFHIIHKLMHHWLSCWPLGSIGTGSIHSSMHLSSWSINYALKPSWCYQICVATLLLRLIHSTLLVGSCKRTKVVVCNLLLLQLEAHSCNMQLCNPWGQVIGHYSCYQKIVTLLKWQMHPHCPWPSPIDSFA